MTFDAIETRAIDDPPRGSLHRIAVPRARSIPRRAAATVLAAMQAAREIEQNPAAHTRRALVYAIAPDGHATLLTAALIAKLLSLKS
ncbi:hypothetical protein [Bradyrhizobium sp. LMG 9283]|uniref:hypothetical protein n=1 Tax=Bradyrhizobium sp. LMG 9283 TaxID=592064 RepID=UPI00388FF335